MCAGPVGETPDATVVPNGAFTVPFSPVVAFRPGLLRISPEWTCPARLGYHPGGLDLAAIHWRDTMKLPRFSIAWIMAITVIAAIDLAAIRCLTGRARWPVH